MSLSVLLDALTKPGCAVCRLKADSADRFVESLLWEGVNDPVRRDEIREAQGFCHPHTWSLVRTGASLGAAIMMRDLLENALASMEASTSRAESGWSLRRTLHALDPREPGTGTARLAAQLTPQRACPACAWAEEMEGIYLDGLVSNLLTEDGLLAAYRASDGLCLPHLREGLAQRRGSRARAALVNAQREIWRRLVGDLSEFIRKNDYRSQDKQMGEERNAWIRGIAAMAGARPEEDMSK
jgi:hypothetical protein